MRYKIREAKSNDIDSVLELYNKLSLSMIEMQREYMNCSEEELGYNNSNSTNREYFSDVLQSENNGIFMVEVDEVPVGFIQTCINEKDFDFHIDRYCYIPYYYIEKKYRNFWFDYELYKVAETWAQKKGLKYICSDVDGGNEVSLMMQKKFCGMKTFKIRLVKEIKPEEMEKCVAI